MLIHVAHGCAGSPPAVLVSYGFPPFSLHYCVRANAIAGVARAEGLRLLASGCAGSAMDATLFCKSRPLYAKFRACGLKLLDASANECVRIGCSGEAVSSLA